MEIRPQFAAVMAATCAAAVLLIVFFRPNGKSLNNESQARREVTAQAGQNVPRRMHRLEAVASAPVSNPPMAAPATVDEEEDFTVKRSSELLDKAMTDDPDALSNILPELNNSDPRIREAAVKAAVQFNSPDAIPALQMAYSQTENLEEKTRIQKAIDFLTLSIADTNLQSGL